MISHSAATILIRTSKAKSPYRFMSQKTIISLIVALASNRAIGKENQLLWHISGDLKRFKKMTLGHTIVMGRNTLLSLPSGPLPKRRNIVLSSSMPDCFGGNCEIAHSLDEVIEYTKNEAEIFIIGGGQVYKQFLPLTDKLYLTVVEKDFEADTFFPEVDFNDFELIEMERITDDPSVDFTYRYETWVRKSGE